MRRRLVALLSVLVAVAGSWPTVQAVGVLTPTELETASASVLLDAMRSGACASDGSDDDATALACWKPCAFKARQRAAHATEKS